MRQLSHPLSMDEEPDSGNRKRVQYALTSVVAQGAIRFMSSVIIGRLAGPASLGVVAALLALSQLANLTWSTSAGAAASKFVARERAATGASAARAAARFIATTAVLATAITLPAAIITWRHLGIDQSVSSLFALGVVITGGSAYVVARGILYGDLQFRRAAMWDVLTASAGLAGVATIAASGLQGPLSLVPIGIAGIIFAASASTRRPSTPLPTAIKREITLFCALGLVGTLSSAGFLQAAQIIANSTLPRGEGGLFSAAVTIATPLSLIAGSLSATLFPSMASQWGTGDIVGFREKVEANNRLLVTGLATAFGSLVILSHFIPPLLFGSHFKDSGNLLPLMLLATFMTSAGAVTTNALTTTSNRGMATSTLCSLSGLAVGAVAWLITIPRLGGMGVALGYLLGTTTIMALPTAITWRAHRPRWGNLYLRTAILLGLSLAVSLTCTNFLACLGLSILYFLFSAFLGRREIGHLVGRPLSRTSSRDAKPMNPAVNVVAAVLTTDAAPGLSRAWPAQRPSPLRRTLPPQKEPRIHPRGHRNQGKINDPILNGVLFVLPTLAAFGGLLPGLAQFFAFRLAVIFLVAHLILFWTRPSANSRTTLSLFLLTGVWLVSGILGLLLGSYDGNAQRSFLPVVIGLTLLVALTRSTNSVGTVQWIGRGWTFSFIVTGLIGLREMLFGVHMPNYLSTVYDTVSYASSMNLKLIASTFGNPNAYATYLLITYAYLLSKCLSASHSGRQLWYATLTVTNIALLLGAGSRLCLTAVAVETLVLVFAYRKSVSRLALLLIAAPTAGLGLLASPASSLLSSKSQTFSILSFINSTQSDTSGQQRADIYRDAWFFIKESRGLGIGPGGLERRIAAGDAPYNAVASPHSAFFEIAANYSIFVLAALLVWLILCARDAWSPSQGSRIPPWTGPFVLTSLCGMVIGCFANSSFLSGSINWVWFATIWLIALNPLDRTAIQQPVDSAEVAPARSEVHNGHHSRRRHPARTRDRARQLRRSGRTLV